MRVRLGVVATLVLVGCTGVVDEEDDDDETLQQIGAARCGVERWAVKTGTDPDVSSVQLTPVDSSIAALVGTPAPASPPTNGRVAPTETQAVTLSNVTLVKFKLESDSDYHLVISDGASTMIAEIPFPSCVGASSRFAGAISAARAAFNARYTPSSSFQTANTPVTITGVPFFDYNHGQSGRAPNSIEIHPILSICFGTNCAPGGGGAPDGGVSPDGGTPPDGGMLPDAAPDAPAGGSPPAVFLILMENHNWSAILGSSSAPYINQQLLPMASHAEQYFNPPNLHPSEPNYIWLEAGSNLGITTDGLPSSNHRSTTAHLVTQLENAGIPWKSYQEDISGQSCPLSTSGLYAPKHNPMVFFDDVTNGNSSSSSRCIAHVRPLSELAGDLAADRVAGYNFVTPNLCNDMHNATGCATSDEVQNGDDWLRANVPALLSSAAYNRGGVIFITWDESEGGEFPIGMIVLSPFARGGGYSNQIHYTHSSTLRTVQEIFGVTPLLGDAANATDLGDLFRALP
jgi:hypothetical protein